MKKQIVFTEEEFKKFMILFSESMREDFKKDWSGAAGKNEAGAAAPEIEFSEELLLEHNYVVLYFDNEFDWQVAKDKFGLKKVKDLIERKGQPTGIGRVLNGAEWIKKL